MGYKFHRIEENQRAVVDPHDLLHCIKTYGMPVGFLPAPVKDGIIHPDSTHFLMKDGSVTAVFTGRWIYYVNRRNEVRPITEVASYAGRTKIILNERWTEIAPWFLKLLANKQKQYGDTLFIPTTKALSFGLDQVNEYLKQKFPIGLGVLTTYPAAGAVSPVDGYLTHNLAADASWSNLRDGTGASISVSNASLVMYQLLQKGTGAGLWRNDYRAIATFDCTSIGSGQTVDSGTLTLRGTGTNVVDVPSCDVRVIGIVMASESSISSADFIAPSTTYLSDTAIADESWTVADGDNNFTLNASGRSHIKMTSGTTKFCLDYDVVIDNAEPTVADGLYSENDMHTADTANNAKNPKLVVNYSALVGMEYLQRHHNAPLIFCRKPEYRKI